MDIEQKNILAQVHNLLCDISVRGEDTIKLASCITAVRTMLVPNQDATNHNGGADEL